MDDLGEVLAVQRGVVGGAAGYEEYEAWLVGIDHCGGPGDIAGCATGGGQQAAPDLRLLGDLGCHQSARLVRLDGTGIGCHDHLPSRAGA